MTKVFEKE
jgi:hypothetical protein